MLPAKESESIGKKKDHCSQKGRRTHPKEAKKEGKKRLCWAWTTSPAALFEKAFEILSRSDQQCLDIDPPEEPQAKAPHAMPLFTFGK